MLIIYIFVALSSLSPIKNGLADVIISEDSDLLVYGAPRVFFKMDANGWGEEILRCNLGANADPEFSFYEWNDEMFKTFCCTSLHCIVCAVVD